MEGEGGGCNPVYAEGFKAIVDHQESGTGRGRPRPPVPCRSISHTPQSRPKKMPLVILCNYFVRSPLSPEAHQFGKRTRRGTVCAGTTEYFDGRFVQGTEQ